MFRIDNLLRFAYNNKIRFCRIEKVGYRNSPILGKVVSLVTGWDATANKGAGGYRSFKVKEMKKIEQLA